MLGVLLGLVLVSFFSAPLIYAATIEYSGLVDIFYRCGASVTDFGTCAGNCFGFITAVGSTTERPPIRVYIGNAEVRVNYTLYNVDDVSQHNLWVAEFWGNGSGSVRVETRPRVETYLQVNFGVGKPMYVNVLALPYFAGRDETKPWEVQLGASGNLVVCTVGKYAARGEVFYNGSWRPASVSTGWYSSVVSGGGSAVKLYWSYTPESAIKVAHIFLTAPKGPDRAYVVGLDGLPVPAKYLYLMAGPGVRVERDGVVSFFGTGYLTYGGRRIELRPNATVVVEGRRCLYVGQTSTGEPLDVEVFLDGKLVVFGRGQVEAFCIPGATKARYTYRMQYPITNVTYTVETDGNYTQPLVEMEIIVHDPSLRPVKSYIIETPPNILLTIVLPEYNYKTTVTAFAGKLEIYPTIPISYLLKTVLSIFEKRSYQLTAEVALYLSIEASILIFLIRYILLLFTKGSMHNIIDKFTLPLIIVNILPLIPLLSIIVNKLPLTSFDLYSTLYSIIYLLLLLAVYLFISVNKYDEQILYIFVILMFVLSVSIYTGMPVSYFIAWTPVLILSIYVALILRNLYLAMRLSTGEIKLNILYVSIFVIALLITVLPGASDRIPALELTLLLLPASKIVHTLHAAYLSFPRINLIKAKGCPRLFSAKELLREKISEFLCRLIRSGKSEDSTSFEIPPYRVELAARLVEDRADRKKFDLTVKVERLGIFHNGTAVMQKIGVGWALTSLQVANMRESYSLPTSGEGGGCGEVAKLVGIFLLAFAIVAIDALTGLFLAIAFTYIFHVVMCEGLRFRWRNALIKLLTFSIALPIFIILTWSYVGPYITAIYNFKQIVFSKAIATLAGKWPYVLLASLVLFYAPVIYQDRRCLVT